MHSYKTAILDISSDEVKVYVGEKSRAGIFTIKSNISKKCDGFIGDSWNYSESLKKAISETLLRAIEKAKCKINKVYVGIPAEFCSVKVCDVERAFKSTKKVSQHDIDLLFDKGENLNYDDKMTTITQSVLYYSLDDGKMVYDPIGQTADSIAAKISYQMCETRLISLVNEVMQSLDITSKAYICTAFAISQSLFDDKSRDKSVLLCEIGENSTFVAIARGSGLLELASFSLGRRHFAEDLSQALQVDKSDAEKLLSQVNFSNGNSNYKLKINGEECVYYSQNVDEIVYYRISSIANTIKKCLAIFNYQCPVHIPMCITGVGSTVVRGLKEEISRVIERRVEIILPNVPGFNTVADSSVMGLFDEAIRAETNKTSFFNRLFKNFGGSGK